ncbi:MAG: hypothetical protein H0T50_11405 [Gemmatimonadales bacterium]|nr:hypothetical protein [Gemmatimonadales bacterium]
MPHRLGFGLGAIAILVLGAGAQFSSHVIPDVAWTLYLGQRILDGARLYVDLIEVNPPLIVWYTLVPVRLSRLLGVADIAVYRAGICLLCLLSTWLCDQLLRSHALAMDPARRRLLVLLVLFALIGLPREDFGEREHLMLVLSLPYVFLAAARAGGERIPVRLAIGVGLLAGLGIALKPYFLTLWLAVEAWLLVGGRVRSLADRIEALLVVSVCLLYLAAVFVVTPEYRTIVAALAGVYFGYLSNSLLVTALLGDGAAVPIFALLAFFALRSVRGGGPLETALAVATAGLYLSAVLQQKGWRYHFYPSMATGMVLLGAMALTVRRRAPFRIQRIYAAAVRVAAVLVPAFVLAGCARQIAVGRDAPYPADPDLARLVQVVRDLAPGGRVMVLSSNMASSFPLVTYAEVGWASRFPSLWLLAAVYWDEVRAEGPVSYRPPRARQGLEQYLSDAVTQDLAMARPEVILVLRSSPDVQGWGVRRLDYLRYLGMDPRFERLFGEYAPVADVGEYRVYRRGAVVSGPSLPPLHAAAASPPPSVSAGVQWGGVSRAMLAQAIVFCLALSAAYWRESRA